MPPTRGLIMWNPTSAAIALGLDVDVVRDYDASGSTLTTRGSMTAGSPTLTLASPLDFRNGQGIAVEGAGPDGQLLVTTIIGGGGTAVLTLAAPAGSAVTDALIQHDDSQAWQAAIDAASAPTVISCPPGLTMNIAAPLLLKSDVAIAFPAATLRWIGPQGGTIFTSPVSVPLVRSAILGGQVDPSGAGRVVDLHSPRGCTFDLDVTDGSPTLTVMRWTGGSGNVVRRLTAGTCGTLLALAGQADDEIAFNAFQHLAGADCHVGGVICEPSGHVTTNTFLSTHLTLNADNTVGVDLGQSDAAPAISNLVFAALCIENPKAKNCTGLSLHRAAQVQVLAYRHTGFPPGTAVNGGQSASYYIRDTGDGSTATIADGTRGWSVTPLKVGPGGAPVTGHLSSFQLIQPVAVPPQAGISTSATIPGARPGDAVVATPADVVPPGLAWNAGVISDGVVALYLANPTQAPLAIGPIHWRFSIWQYQNEGSDTRCPTTPSP